jgi:hypothetical protein
LDNFILPKNIVELHLSCSNNATLDLTECRILYIILSGNINEVILPEYFGYLEVEGNATVKKLNLENCSSGNVKICKFKPSSNEDNNNKQIVNVIWPTDTNSRVVVDDLRNLI